jgi:hypothetical protein
MVATIAGRNPEPMIKGAISQIIVEEMFRELGFYVMRFGKEHTLNPLTQMSDFISSCGGKFSLEKEEKEWISSIATLNKLPDLVIVSKDGTVEFVEIKFRHDACLWEKDIKVFSIFPWTMVLVVNNFVSDSLFKGNKYRKASICISNDPVEMKEKQERLKKTRFHAWVKVVKEEGKEEGEKTFATLFSPLSDFLLEHFGIENDEIIKKYGKLVQEWIPEKPKTTPTD